MRLILLVEDDEYRAAEIKNWIPTGSRCVWARSAGAAMGILRRDQFVGVLLDYDLYGRKVEDAWLTGEDVAAVISETQSRDCKILVHSQNAVGARRVVEFLLDAGFDVNVQPWAKEKREAFVEWLNELSSDE